MAAGKRTMARFYDVRRPALKRCVRRLTFGIGAFGRIAVGNARHPATAAKGGQDEATDASLLPGCSPL